MKHVFISAFALMFLLQGCAMFSSWKSIPAPGGCDQCHTVAISTNWQVAYKPVNLSDSSGRPYFQSHEYYLSEKEKQSATLESKKVGELQCFECHTAPTPAHRERKGRFHH